MSSTDDEPVVESPPEGDAPDLNVRALNARIKQQEILAELGVTALQGASFDELLAATAQLTAQGLDAEFCKVLEHIPSENRFLVRAGVGWADGIVGHASVGSDLASPAGFALRTGKPVISNHLENEERFRTPEVLRQHGVRRAMNVILQGDGRPFGVLEVDSRSENEFVEHDLAFLQGAANILGMAIERERHERSLKAGLQRHKMLLKEMNHRVKNSLAMVASMLRLQARTVTDAELTTHLNEAVFRVAAIAKAHDQLSFSTRIEQMDIGAYIDAVSKDLDASVAHCKVETAIERGIEIATHRAISVALIVNELITNAAKYAYDGRSSGTIWIAVARQGQAHFAVSVRDEGVGVPANFDPSKAKGLGMKIVTLFAQQLGGEVKVCRLSPGTEFEVIVPLET
jgi:two-component sensor histidine kinase